MYNEYEKIDRILIISILVIIGWAMSANFLAWYNPFIGLVYTVTSAIVIYMAMKRWWKKTI